MSHGSVTHAHMYVMSLLSAKTEGTEERRRRRRRVGGGSMLGKRWKGRRGVRRGEGEQQYCARCEVQ